MNKTTKSKLCAVYEMKEIHKMSKKQPHQPHSIRLISTQMMYAQTKAINNTVFWYFISYKSLFYFCFLPFSSVSLTLMAVVYESDPAGCIYVNVYLFQLFMIDVLFRLHIFQTILFIDITFVDLIPITFFVYVRYSI